MSGIDTGGAFVCRWEQTEVQTLPQLVEDFDLFAAGNPNAQPDPSGKCGPAPTSPLAGSALADARTAVRSYVDGSGMLTQSDANELRAAEGAGLLSPAAVQDARVNAEVDAAKPAAQAPQPSSTDHTRSYKTAGGAAFEGSFVTTCTRNNDASACQCVLRSIEAAEPLATVEADFHDIAIGRPPQWFVNAREQCVGG